MDLLERNSLHLELPELVRSREAGAEEDGTCPERCVGRSSGSPQAVAEARPSVRCLSGGGAQHQGSTLSKAS